MTGADRGSTARRAQRPPYGLRGWLLLVWGSVWLVWGGTLASTASTRAGIPTYDVVHRLAPLEVWGGAWATVGAAAVLAGLLRRHAAGFVVLSLLPVGWGLMLAAAAVTADATSGVPVGLTFVGIGVAIALTSRMEDARLVLSRAPPRDGDHRDER